MMRLSKWIPAFAGMTNKGATRLPRPDKIGVRNDKRGLAMTGEIVMRCST